jgi:hypothetical protein
MPTTLLFPVMVWVATVFIYAYFVIVLWYLASAGSWDAAQHRYIWNEDLQRLMVHESHILKSKLYSDFT